MSSDASTTHLSAITVEAVAYHGWGFDRSCWQSWKLMLEQIGCEFQAFDRGYFGRSAQPEFKNTVSKKILLAHSFGLHLCPISQLELAEILIVFNGFIEFHPSSHPARKRSQTIVRQMIDQFEKNPQLVLDNFWRKCYYPLADYPNFAVQESKLNSDLLLADLNQLNQSMISIDLLNSIPQIFIFQGSRDRIVSPMKGQEFLADCSMNSQYFEILRAGHALPFTDLEECWSLLSPLLQPLLA